MLSIAEEENSQRPWLHKIPIPILAHGAKADHSQSTTNVH